VVPPIAEFTEIETGKRNDRPQLKEALALCRKRKAKLVIAKLDRLSETNGVAERFFQTFKEQVVHGRIYQTIDDVRAAVRKFFELYNAEWLIEKNGLRSPRQTRFAWQQASMARLRPWLFARIWYETKRKLNSLLWSGVSRVSTTLKGRSDLCCPPWQCPLYLCSSAGRQINDLVASVTRIVIWIGYSRFGL
jgi:hypothetical protein